MGCGDDATAASANGTTGTTGASSTGATSRADTASRPADTGPPIATTGADQSTGRPGTGGRGASASGNSGGEPTSDGRGSSSGEAVIPEPVLSFTDAALLAGVSEAHGVLQSPPNCLIDQFGPGVGAFCISERMSGASAVGDFDDDGLPDLFFARTYGADRLYRNNGDGTLTDVAFASGIFSGNGSSGSVFADFDNDGDQDLYITRIGALRYDLYINEGGTFTEEAIARGASLKSEIQHSPTGVAVGDYDLDGYLDLYVGEWKTQLGLSKEPSHSRLLHNLGAAAPGHFEDVTNAVGVNVDEVWDQANALAGTYTFSPSFADLDGDDHPDLAIVADFGCSRLFWNNGDGTFTDGTGPSGAGVDRNGMGGTLGDFDGDGDLDWFITAITLPTGVPENRLLRNLGNRQFSDLAAALGVGEGGWGWGTTFLDIDNDADLDLMMTGGYYYTTYLEDPNRLWLGDGNGAMSPDVAPDAGLLSPSGAQGRGLNTLDFDGDGDLDIFLVNNNGLPNLFRNDSAFLGDWLQLRAVGTTSNRDGIGAKVTVQVDEGGPTQYREVGTMSHYVGEAGREVHFGLGWGEAPIHEVRVYFPVSGTTHVFNDVARNQRMVVVE